MEMDKEVISLTDYKKEVNIRISQNISYLMDRDGYNQNQLRDVLHQHGVEINQGTINKYLHKASTNIIPVAILIKFSEIFNVSLENLIRDDLNNTKAETISTVNQKKGTNRLLENQYNSEFVTDIKDRAFKGYKGEYYCYFYPTISSEDNLLSAKLTITDEDPQFPIKISLEVPKEVDGKTKAFFKIYQGTIILSKSLHNCYCILKSDKLSEFNFLVFRHIYLNDAKLDCRMAEVLTVSAGESHYPTVHRLFFSRDKIAPEHLEMIMPLLRLNSSDIIINRERMDVLKQKGNIPKDIIEQLEKECRPQEFYIFKENYFRSVLELRLPKIERKKIKEYIAKVREQSFSYKFNKVSKKLDDNIRQLLMTLGYYK